MLMIVGGLLLFGVTFTWWMWGWMPGWLAVPCLVAQVTAVTANVWLRRQSRRNREKVSVA